MTDPDNLPPRPERHVANSIATMRRCLIANSGQDAAAMPMLRSSNRQAIAIKNLVTLSPRVIVFVIVMTEGMVLHDIWSKRRPMIWHEETLAIGSEG